MFDEHQITGRTRTHVLQYDAPRFAAHPDVAAAFLRLRAAAGRDGIELRPYSSFRGYAAQARIWAMKFNGRAPLYDIDGRVRERAGWSEDDVITHILDWSAPPGASRHQWGTEIDVVDGAVMPPGYKPRLLPDEVAEDGLFAPLHRWLDAHIHEHGFFRPYARWQGGMFAEPWHLSYAPVSMRAIDDLTLQVLRRATKASDLPGKARVLARLPEILERHVRNIVPPPSECAWQARVTVRCNTPSARIVPGGDNCPMLPSPTRVRFTKMQGAGNDFVVLDATREPLALGAEEMRRLGDRRFGVGADQILIVERPTTPGMDFSYRIFNNTGDEVEHCGNGARCFARYVRDRGMIGRDTIRVQTVNNQLELHIQADGRVRVDMNAPRFEHAELPFDGAGLVPARVGDFETWPLNLGEGRTVDAAVLSMGNPHAVVRVSDVEHHPVLELGPLVEQHPRFVRRVNAGFMQVVSRSHIRLRVYERDAGETLACGTGACAAVVAGIRLGWLDPHVDIDMHGGKLTVEWAGGPDDSVFLTGPATTVFEGEIDL